MSNMMYTGNDGVSYYKIGKHYFKNSGVLEREITEDEYNTNISRIKKEIEEKLK